MREQPDESAAAARVTASGLRDDVERLVSDLVSAVDGTLQRMPGGVADGAAVAQKEERPRIEVLPDQIQAGLREFARRQEAFETNAAARFGEIQDSLRRLLHRLDEVAAATVRQEDALETKTGALRDEIRQQMAQVQNQLKPVPEQIRDSIVMLSEKLDYYIREALRRQRPPAFRAGEDMIVTEVEGLILGIPADEWRLAAYYVYRGLLEPGLIHVLLNLLKPGGVFVDVGANLGIVTLFAARRMGPSGKVYSFEPAPRTFSILRENMQVNAVFENGRVELHQLALLDKAGSAPFHIVPCNSGHNTLYAGVPSSEIIEVETATLDEVLPPGTRIDAIKIDAEGAEPFIWRGMQRVLRENPGIDVLFEFAPMHLGRAGCDPAAFLDEVEGLGFRIRQIDEPSGELLTVSRESLLAASSVNLYARRDAAD